MSRSGPSLGQIIHHDDAEREVAYDRDSKIGKLDTAWDKPLQEGWIVVSMQDDWNRIFPFESSGLVSRRWRTVTGAGWETN